MTRNSTDYNYVRLENLDGGNILISFLNVVLVFVIIVGNILTVTAIAKFRQLQYPSNIMIASLSLADLLMGVAYTPIKLMRAHAPTLLNRRPVCLMFMFVSHFCSLNAILFLAIMSIERFYAVQFPFHYHVTMTIRSAIVNNFIVFLVTVAVCVPTVTGTDLWYNGVQCYAPTLYPDAYTKLLIVASFGSMFIGFVCFLRVAAVELNFRRRARDVNRARDQDMEMSHDATVNLRAEDNNEIEVRGKNSTKTKLVLTAYTCSLCLWTPHVIVYLWDSVTKQHQNPYVFRVVTLLDLSSSAVNCFLYGWKNSRFREAYWRLLGFKRTQVMPSVHSITA